MNKRVIASLLILAVMSGLCACSSGSSETSEMSSSAVISTEVEETTTTAEETTEETTELVEEYKKQIEESFQNLSKEINSEKILKIQNKKKNLPNTYFLILYIDHIIFLIYYSYQVIYHI